MRTVVIIGAGLLMAVVVAHRRFGRALGEKRCEGMFNPARRIVTAAT